MRYLYGDSSPFSLQYNFLATLESFVASAARAAQLAAESRAIQDSAAESAVARGKSLAALESFHQVVVRAVQDAAGRSTDAQVLDYARQLIEHSARIVEDTKRTSIAIGERDQATTRAEIDRRKGEIRRALEQFLTAGRIPVLESRVAMRLVDSRNELSATFTHPDAIITSFTLSVESLPDWKQPRRVGDFSTGLDLMVGTKKSMFKRTVQPETVHLDEYVVSGFDLSDDAASIRLKRKVADARETFIFNLRRVDSEIYAQVEHPSEVESEAPTNLDTADREHLEKLWQLLRARVSDALTHKERLLTAQLDGHDLFDTGAIPFIERIIKLIAPTVAEISRRSPNPQELSLKMESDGGRREEIYLKKEDLLGKLEPLGESERQLFAPLALSREKWHSEVSVQPA